jgi:hypothetical protein
MQHFPPKRRYLCTGLHGVTSLKTNIYRLGNISSHKTLVTWKTFDYFNYLTVSNNEGSFNPQDNAIQWNPLIRVSDWSADICNVISAVDLASAPGLPLLTPTSRSQAPWISKAANSKVHTDVYTTYAPKTSSTWEHLTLPIYFYIFSLSSS